jgi:hypothetical protein
VRSLTSRLDQLEATHWANMPAIDRAYARIRRGETAESLTDEETDAFLSVPEAQYLKALPDSLIDSILARPESEPWLSTLQAAYAVGTDAFQQALAEAITALEGMSNATANH